MIKMYRYIKLTLIVSFILLCLPFVLIAGYDIFYFQSKLQTTLDSANTATQTFSPSFIKLADIHYGRYLPAIVAITLDATSPQRNNIRIYINSKLLDFHLTRAEQLKIVASKMYLGKNYYGFQDAAIGMYNKPFQSLSAEETAKLITLYKSSNYYLKHPEKHLEATERLLAHANLRS
jgi:Transglycosylase